MFRGSATAIVTPMKDNGEIDFKALSSLVQFQLDNSTDAIVVNGTTGESSTLEEWEKLELIDTVVQKVDGRVPVIAGTGCNCTSKSVFLSKMAQALGADGLLLVTPYYNKASQKGLVEHFFAVADQVDLPVILYNVPTRTCVNIEPETCLSLSAHPNIRGIKEASGNLSQIVKIAALCGENLDIYSGNDDQTLPILSIGGKGVISVLGNIMPKEMHQICGLYFEGKLEESRNLYLELLSVMNAMFYDVNPVPVKTAMAAMGLCGETCRLPLTAMREEDRNRLMKAMKEIKSLKALGGPKEITS